MCLSVCVSLSVFRVSLSVCVSLIVSVSGSWHVCVCLSLCMCMPLIALKAPPHMQGPQSEIRTSESQAPYQVSSLRSGYEEVKPHTLGSSYPRAAKDQRQLQASLRSPLIGVQSPLSPPSGSST